MRPWARPRRLPGVAALYLVAGLMVLLSADWRAAGGARAPAGILLLLTGAMLQRLGPAGGRTFPLLAALLLVLALFQTQWPRLLVLPVGLWVAHRALAEAGGSGEGGPPAGIWLAALAGWLLVLAALLLPAVWHQHGS